MCDTRYQPHTPSTDFESLKTSLLYAMESANQTCPKHVSTEIYGLNPSNIAIFPTPPAVWASISTLIIVIDKTLLVEKNAKL